MDAGHAPITLGSAGSRGTDAGGFRVTWIRFPPLARLPLHSHDRATVAVILRGSFDGLLRHGSHACPAASLQTEPPGEPHGNVFERAGADVLTVQPDPGRPELLEPFASVLGEVNHLRDPAVATVASRAAGELRAPDPLTPFAVEGLVLELLALAARLTRSSGLGCERRAPAWLAEARSLLHDRYAEPPRIGELAAAVGVHPAHLARTFREHYGTPLGSYARRLRISWAAARLRGCDDDIAGIAVAAGFYDQSHFTRAFRRQVGTTPMAYRRAFRQ